MNTAFVRQFKQARARSCPLVAIKTPDQAVTIETLNALAGTNGSAPPVLVWDSVRGMRWLNDAGYTTMWGIVKPPAPNGQPALPPSNQSVQKEAFALELSKLTANVLNALVVALKLPKSSLLIVCNFQWQWETKVNVQAAWNLRDPFKSDFRTLAMLTDMSSTVPIGLRDALQLTEELPTVEELGAIVDEQFDAALEQSEGTGCKDKKVRTAAIDAVCGLSAYIAEESIALSFDKKPGAVKPGLDIDLAWKRKCDQIATIRGLKVKRGGPTFARVGGNVHIIDLFTRLFRGKQPPAVLVLLDEFEKMLAGSDTEQGGGDHKTEIVGGLLTEMESQEYEGLIEFGVPGASKTYIAQCAAATFDVPLITMSIPDLMEKWVGSSNENFGAAMATVRAVSQGRAFFIGTCNSMVNISGPMRRRFCWGEWFFDLPSEEERAMIWPIHMAAYGLDVKQKRPVDDGWTGAEIRNCCRAASKMDLTLNAAAEFISPVAVTMAAQIDAMRMTASGKFKSAAYPGVYNYQQVASVPAPIGKQRRAMKVE
jgi:hypothetical protein